MKMDIAVLLNNRELKPKAKTEILSSWLLDSKVSSDELISFAESAKDTVKATCIEAIEFASKHKPLVVNKKTFHFVSQALTSKAPRIKWESAKVIGNTAHLFSDEQDVPIKNLLDNSEHKGTVVRWSAAFALGEILKIKSKHNKDLIPFIEAVFKREEKNSIKKIYFDALKQSRE